MPVDPASAKTLVNSRERVSLDRGEELPTTPLEPRYREIAPLGEGGMGEVRLVRDAVVGRDVAIKRVLSSMDRDAATRERFLREARVQGQLEHPSIVPVYDLALAANGRIYFTMRRVLGRTLDESANGEQHHTRHALLTAMSRVCLAVDFAHSRGVIHRDIKPSNVMLGDYGEVYILDWGLAKLTGADDLAPSESIPESRAGKTTAGSVLGTPGYMAPEQALGLEVDELTDVYALGVCLFEVLAGVPLVEFAGVPQMIAATIQGVDARLSKRAPGREIPVELEAICVRATQLRPEDRFVSARAMSDAIERFLEGDRDLERRRMRAREHASAAVELTTRAVDRSDNDARRDAMREVGHALANDPENDEARRALVRLLTEPPRVVPPEVLSQMAAHQESTVRTARRRIAFAFSSTIALNLVVLWMGVLEWPLFLVSSAAAVGGVAIASVPAGSFANERRVSLSILGCVAMTALSRVASPFIVVPTLALCLGIGLVFPRRTPATVAMTVVLFAILLPFALEWVGVFRPTFHVELDRITIEPHMSHLQAAPLFVWFLAGTAIPVIAMCLYLAHVRDQLLVAEEKIQIQAWQLRQILPHDRPSAGLAE